MSMTEKRLGELPNGALAQLRRADALWSQFRAGAIAPTPVVHSDSQSLETIDWDVVICGGTLGIFIGCALVQQGWRVAVLERSVLQGREQEWNISRHELAVLVDLGLISVEALEEAIATEFNPVQVRFHQGMTVPVRDVLNVGISPCRLIAQLKAKFVALGGAVIEQTPVESVTIHPNGALVVAGQALTTRLVLDAMGHFSPIARQARNGQSPDAVCLVVGTCAEGFPANSSGDLFASITPIQGNTQYFWEAFPAQDGRTTYLFTYMDAHPERPSLEALFEEYFRLLPEYQAVDVEQLTIKRALYGFFPCYRNSPLRSPWDRIVHIGDSSGSQSPLSFGGFGAMLRHLRRLSIGLHAALKDDLLDRRALAQLHPYQPNLSVTWLFQKSMSVQVGQSLPPNQINELLSTVFQSMSDLGEPILKPFLQDVVQFSGLSQTLALTTVRHPGLVLKLLPQVGIPAIAAWLIHFLNLGLYTMLYRISPLLMPWVKSLPSPYAYYLHRWVEAWQYGSGNDYSQS